MHCTRSYGSSSATDRSAETSAPCGQRAESIAAGKQGNLEREDSREMYNDIDFDKIDINAKPPAQEPDRQYYYIAKCKFPFLK